MLSAWEIAICNPRISEFYSHQSWSELHVFLKNIHLQEGCAKLTQPLLYSPITTLGSKFVSGIEKKERVVISIQEYNLRKLLGFQSLLDLVNLRKPPSLQTESNLCDSATGTILFPSFSSIFWFYIHKIQNIFVLNSSTITLDCKYIFEQERLINL